MTANIARPPPETESELLDAHVAPYAGDIVRQSKVSLQQFLRKSDSIRVAPSTLSGVQDVLHAVYVPVECAAQGNSWVLSALPGDVVAIMDTAYLRKTYLFFDKPEVPSSSSTASKKQYRYDAKDTSREGRKPDIKATSVKLSKDEEKEAERRRNLNTVVVAAVPVAAGTVAPTAAPHSSRGFVHRGPSAVPPSRAAAIQPLLVCSIVGDSIAVYVLHDLASSSRGQDVTAASVHKACSLPEGSWKRVRMAFNNDNGERLLAVLRPSGAHQSQQSRLLVMSRPLSGPGGKFLGKDAVAASFGVVPADAWIAGPPDVVWSGWLDAVHPALLDRHGTLYVYTLDAGGRLSASSPPSQASIPVGGTSVTAACVSRSAAGSLMLYTALDGILLHSFELVWEAAKKRPRDSQAMDSSLPSTLAAIPTHAHMTCGFRIQTLTTCVAFQQPMLIAALETGAIVVHHGVHLETLYHFPYRRLCKDTSLVRLNVAVKERPFLQLCLFEDETATILKS